MLYCMWFLSVVFSVALYFFLKELQILRKDISGLVISHTNKTTKETELMEVTLKNQELEGQSIYDTLGARYNA
jgi:hypothetical protein